MTIQDYKKIKATGLIGIFGSMNQRDKIVQCGHSSFEKLPNYEEENLPMDIIMGQLNSPVDFKNIIILFTSCGSYGSNRFFGKILSDHCTYPLEVRWILDKHKIKFKNNISIVNREYIQTGMMMLIVQDGVAYVVTDYADPTAHIGKEDDHKVKLSINDKVTIEDKNIMLSGFFVHRFRKS